MKRFFSCLLSRGHFLHQLIQEEVMSWLLFFRFIFAFLSNIAVSINHPFVSFHYFICFMPLSQAHVGLGPRHFPSSKSMTTLQVWAVFGMCVAGNWCPWLQVYIQSTIVVGKPEHCTTICQETPDGNQVTTKTKAFHDAMERTGREVCLKTTNLW